MARSNRKSHSMKVMGLAFRLLFVVLWIFSLSLPSSVLGDGIDAPYDWYRYQGAADSGPQADINCEVTSLAMVIQFSKGNQWVPIRAVREFIGHNGLTSTADAKRALTNWGVTYAPVNNVQEIIGAIQRGHIVIVGLIMARISPGSDYNVGKSSPQNRYGRYYPFDGPHSVVVKGISLDGQWLIVNDPNVWDGNPIYWYSDGTAKGKDRYYRVSELEAAMKELSDSPKGLEILDTAPASQPALTPPAESISLYQGGPIATFSSNSPWWWSTTIHLSVVNPTTRDVTIDQIGLQGTTPSNKGFYVSVPYVTIRAKSEEHLAIPMATNEDGRWTIGRVLYYVGGAWRELDPHGYPQNLTFAVPGVSAK